MKLLNKDIIEITEALSALIQDTAPLPAIVSFAVVRNFKLLQPIAEDIHNERLGILERYSDNSVTEEGITYYNVPKEKQEAANKELEDLLTVSTSVPLVTFPLDKLIGHDIPIKTMNVLYFMVEDGEGK